MAMKRMLASGLGVTLGLMTATGQAQELNWRAAKSQTPPALPVAKAGAPQPPPPVTLALTPIAVVAISEPAPVPAAPVPAPRAQTTVAATTADQPSDRPRPVTVISREGAETMTASVGDVKPVSAMLQSSPTFAQAPPQDGIRWVTARAKGSEEDVVAIPKELPTPTDKPAAPGTLVTSVTEPAAAANQPTTAGVHPSYLVGQDPCCTCVVERAPRFSVTAEYLGWWVKGANIPPLVTTSPPNGANGVPGALPGSTVLLSGDDLDTTFRQGGRLGTVWWLDDCASCGIDSRSFYLGRIVNRFAVNSAMVPNLFRPFTAANPGLGAFSEQVTRGGTSIGGVRAENQSMFWGSEINYRDNICCGCNYRVDLLAGFRYLQLDERFTIVEDFTRLTPLTVQDFPGGPVSTEPAGTRVIIRDSFGTRNQFYGGQLGFVGNYWRDRWSLDFRTTVALGTTHQELNIEGSQTRLFPGAMPAVFNGGLLALNSNIGERSRDVFSVVPEVGLTVGYQLTDHLKTFVGYNFLYWSNVIRPGDQIDTTIDVNRVARFVPPGITVPDAGQVRPAVLFKETDFWAHGITAGFEYRW
jgi:hypothetical protein